MFNLHHTKIVKYLDKKNREFIQIKENLEKEKKDISRSKDKSLFEKSKKRVVDCLNFLTKAFSALKALIILIPPKVSSKRDKNSPCSF